MGPDVVITATPGPVHAQSVVLASLTPTFDIDIPVGVSTLDHKLLFLVHILANPSGYPLSYHTILLNYHAMDKGHTFIHRMVILFMVAIDWRLSRHT